MAAHWHGAVDLNWKRLRTRATLYVLSTTEVISAPKVLETLERVLPLAILQYLLSVERMSLSPLLLEQVFLTAKLGGNSG